MPPFGSHLNFLDPQTTEDGQPYAPKRYKEIVKECYVISKNLNTAYTDILQVTPTERYLMLTFLKDEVEQMRKNIEKMKAEREANKNNKGYR